MSRSHGTAAVAAPAVLAGSALGACRSAPGVAGHVDDRTVTVAEADAIVVSARKLNPRYEPVFPVFVEGAPMGISFPAEEG
ncbi:hypothetical protein ABT297_16215 [Dactylosporangium sp. NPDC000555]|uniref:hypothetical protein n=1 Tax=Dactylosporangium sp. NPDC000555 TaxID=3154260 RepID=UPI0033232A1D